MGSRASSFFYDANGNPDYAVTPDNQIIDYTYDVMGRLREEVRPGNNRVLYPEFRVSRHIEGPKGT